MRSKIGAHALMVLLGLSLMACGESADAPSTQMAPALPSIDDTQVIDDIRVTLKSVKAQQSIGTLRSTSNAFVIVGVEVANQGTQPYQSMLANIALVSPEGELYKYDSEAASAFSRTLDGVSTMFEQREISAEGETIMAVFQVALADLRLADWTVRYSLYLSSPLTSAEFAIPPFVLNGPQTPPGDD